MKQQTAVEWLIEKIEKHYIVNNAMLNPEIVMQLKRQAKEMEQQQIIDAYNSGRSDVINKNNIYPIQYYNETFKKK